MFWARFVWVDSAFCGLHESHGAVTFLGEELAAVFPGGDHLTWDLPQKLHDQSDVIWPPWHPRHTHSRTHTHTEGHIQWPFSTYINHMTSPLDWISCQSLKWKAPDGQVVAHSGCLSLGKPTQQILRAKTGQTADITHIASILGLRPALNRSLSSR